MIDFVARFTTIITTASTSRCGIGSVDHLKTQAVLRAVVQWMKLEKEKQKWHRRTVQVMRTGVTQMAKNLNNVFNHLLIGWRNILIYR